MDLGIRVGDKLILKGHNLSWEGVIDSFQAKRPDYVEIVGETPSMYIGEAHFSTRYGDSATITECITKAEIITKDVTFERYKE